MKFLIMLICCFIFMSNITVFSETSDLSLHASSAVLMDAQSGSILYEENMHEKLYPASMTKMMSLYLVLEAIHEGMMEWDDMVSASSHAASMGGSQIYLEPGEQMSVLDLFKASTVASANDAITALAEKTAGSEEEFVKRMNETAVSFGCQNTHFVNPTGLHDENHVSTAYDMALIAKHLIDEGQDELLQYTSLMEDYIRKDTDNPFWLVNTNKMLRSYDGMDGLKTGYTSQSMYCITVTAKRNGLRLIAVVMKEPDKKSRTEDIQTLLNYGFSKYVHQTVLDQYELNEIMSVDKGVPEEIEITNEIELGYTAEKGKEKTEISRIIQYCKTQAPIQKDEVVGTIQLTYQDNTVLTSNLIALNSSEKLTFITIFKTVLKEVLF